VSADQEAPAIDIHHHAITPRYRENLGFRSAAYGAAGIPGLPKWTAQASLAWMESAGVDRSLLSPTARGFGLGDKEWAVRFAREAHEDLLDVREADPGRFGVLAPLPLPFLEESLTQAEQALRRDGTDGIGLLTQYTGTYVGEPVWDELLELLDQHSALVHVHPTAPPNTPLRDFYGPHLIDYTFDTTRVLVLLAKRRLYSRFPRIRWVFAHGGGTLPFILERLTNGESSIDGGDRVSDLLRCSCFDTALVGRPALAALAEFAGSSRMVFGSDAPFIHGTRYGRALDELSASFPGEGDRFAIRRGTMLRLLGDRGRQFQHERDLNV
jgi:predicted TIM-barrel fold metal-dependent hydrolase